MALIVQKYGGTSVADAERIQSVAQRIAARHRAGDKLVVVVSAMGDTTDRLLELASQVSEHPEARELDVLLSTGEMVTKTLVAMALHSLDIEAVSLTGAQAGLRTDTAHGRARILEVEPTRIERELERGRVVIVAGFQGISEELEVTTLGRGASDITPVALAAALKAERSFLQRLGGGCKVPVAAYARLIGQEIRILAMAALPDGSRIFRDEVRCDAGDPVSAGIVAAEALLAKGAREIVVAD